MLLPRADGSGRVAAREIMFVNQAIQNLIREDKIHQIANVISTRLREDMVTLDDSLAELRRARHRDVRDRLPLLRGHREARACCRSATTA